MDFIWNKDLALLLIYKDPLGGDPLAGSYTRSQSVTISEHLQVRRSTPPSQDANSPSGSVSLLTDQLSLFDASGGNIRYKKEAGLGCSVWGWWRKTWETHHSALASLKQAIERGAKPSVLLYNQYLRRLYKAILHDLYFEPNLTSVTVPAYWEQFCPSRYRHIPHLCGAFFALEINPAEENAAELQSYFTDSSSFELENTPVYSPPPEGVVTACNAMIDSPPQRQNIRACEQTLFVVRSYKQREHTARILSDLPANSESGIAHAIAETTWGDLVVLLKGVSPNVWGELGKKDACIEELGKKAQAAKARSTRFDFELFSKLCRAPLLAEIIVEEDGSEGFSGLGSSLRDWLLASTERTAREKAADVFAEAWRFAGRRYGLAEMPARYFRNLPAIEAIASAVKHEIGKKFYRDHLSHNVRAALLSSSFLVGTESEDDDINVGIVGFMAGLFHDIALPLSTFPETVGQLAAALGEAQADSGGERRLGGAILERRLLKKSLHYVALLSSIRNLPVVARTEPFRPWESEAAMIRLTDTQVLMEELLCLASDEHALISAALLFDYAVSGESEGAGADFDTKMRTLVARLMGPTSSPAGREFAATLQCMALHDRRPAAKHHGVTEVPKDTPKVLESWEFPLPVTVQIADELQEWGRTLGKLDEIGAVDATIEFSLDKVRATFALSPDIGVFESVPFSPLEYLFGKVRALGRLRVGSAESNRPISLRLGLESLSVFELIYIAPASDCRLDIDYPFAFLDANKWPQLVPARQVERGNEDEYIFGVRVRGSKLPRDIFKIQADAELAGKLRQHCEMSLACMMISGREVSFSFADGFMFTLNVKSYRFGRLAKTTTPGHLFAVGSECALLSATLVKINPSEKELQGLIEEQVNQRPHPHFLDFDWRFVHLSCRAIVRMARDSSTAGARRICYLGCPSLALWHAIHYPEDEDWLLLDRGHFALQQWVLSGGWLPRDKYRTYDVFDSIEEELRHSFDVVLTDPPWYEPEYGLFASRAVELLKPNGVLGITYYPPSLDPGKFERFRRTVFRERIQNFREFGALEIAYSIPAFELSSGVHREFQHPELGTYRSGFMDFFEAPEDLMRESAPFGDRFREDRPFPKVIPMNGEHHLRCVSDEEWEAKGGRLRIAFTRRGIDRPRKIPSSWVGWSTRNTIARVTKSKSGVIVESQEELAEAVEDLETSGRPIPRERN